MLMQFRSGSCTSGSRGSCWCWCWCHLVFGALIVGSCMLLAVAGWCCRLARAAAQVAAAAHGGATAALQPHAASSSCGSCYRCCHLVVTPGASSRSVVVPNTAPPSQHGCCGWSHVQYVQCVGVGACSLRSVLGQMRPKCVQEEVRSLPGSCLDCQACIAKLVWYILPAW